MQIKDTYRSKIIAWYCIIFYLLMIYKWANGMFLYQLQPYFFYIRPDLITWLFMQTGLHKWLLNNYYGCVLFDVAFYVTPLLFFCVYRNMKKFTSVAAIFMLCINWIYVQCYTLYPSNSIEGHVAWLLFPIIFIPKKEETFLLLFEGLRYFFLFLFGSAGIWKIAQYGLFHTDEMSGVLLYQHKELLTNSADYWYSNVIMYLINHPLLSYLLYLSSALLEFFFIVGFFTKRYDKYLLAAFVMFLLMNHLIMRIPYYEVAPFILTLLFKQATKPVEKFSFTTVENP